MERRPLVVKRGPGSLGERQLAAVKLRLTGEDAKQGRLAGTVRP
jgi:hypothetical protein